jgi:hypothetical protein
VKTFGRKRWVIPGGHVSLHSTGLEPVFTSLDKLSILNTSDKNVTVKLTIFYEKPDPVEGYEVEIPARRVRSVRFNDLIDPQAMPLDTPYACIVEATSPVVIAFSRLDSGQRENAMLSTIAFAPSD